MGDLEAAGYGYTPDYVDVVESGAWVGRADRRKAKVLGERSTTSAAYAIEEGITGREELLQLSCGRLGLLSVFWDAECGPQYSELELIEREAALKWLKTHRIFPSGDLATELGLKDYDAETSAEKADAEDEAGTAAIGTAFVENGKLWIEVPDSSEVTSSANTCPIELADREGCLFVRVVSQDGPISDWFKITHSHHKVLSYLRLQFPKAVDSKTLKESLKSDVADPKKAISEAIIKVPDLAKVIALPGRQGQGVVGKYKLTWPAQPLQSSP